MTGTVNVIFAFSADHVVRLTGLSKGQLRYWDRTGFFAPTYAFENRRSPYSRIYSFRDVVGLRTISVLRNTYKISLQNLREVARELKRYMAEPWAGIVLYIVGREVHFREPATEKIRGVLSGQYVADIRLEEVANDMGIAASKLKERDTDQIGQIARNRYTQHNAWVIAGTRIPVKAIWRFHEAGYSTQAILKEYPILTERDVENAIEHERKLALSA
ncbi:MAG: DUF433 domain-containing protein [Alphaproteobacteria bacterium]